MGTHACCLPPLFPAVYHPMPRCVRPHAPLSTTPLSTPPATKRSSDLNRSSPEIHAISKLNPSSSPSGLPLLSGPPTLTDIHQIFTPGA